jgi:hypothetical protein
VVMSSAVLADLDDRTVLGYPVGFVGPSFLGDPMGVSFNNPIWYRSEFVGRGNPVVVMVGSCADKGAHRLSVVWDNFRQPCC